MGWDPWGGGGRTLSEKLQAAARRGWQAVSARNLYNFSCKNATFSIHFPFFHFFP